MKAMMSKSKSGDWGDYASRARQIIAATIFLYIMLQGELNVKHALWALFFACAS